MIVDEKKQKQGSKKGRVKRSKTRVFDDKIYEEYMSKLKKELKRGGTVQEKVHKTLYRVIIGSYYLYNLGLRINELSKIKREDLIKLWEGEIIEMETSKTKRVRDLWLSEKAREWGRRHNLGGIMSSMGMHEQGLLYNEKGKKLDSLAVIKMFNRYLVEYKTTSHKAFRHAYIQKLSKEGVELDTISKIVGHSDIKTTARYNIRRLSKEELKRHINKI